jgi:hypothetical protein
MAEPTDQLLTYGALLTCSVEFVGDSDLFRFFGVAGEVVHVQATDRSNPLFGPGVFVELRGTTGSILATASHVQAAVISLPLTETGMHLIRVSEAGNDQVIPYTLVLDRLAPASPAALQLNPGDRYQNIGLNPQGDADLYTFRGAAGDLISLTVTDNGNPSFWEGVIIQLFDPNGSLVTAAANYQSALIETSLAQPGDYVVRITELDNDHPASYNLEYLCLVGVCPTAFPLNVSRTGSGSVTSVPAGIDCGLDCTERYLAGTVVTLSAVPAGGAVFNGWSGDADCDDGIVTMTAARHCIASFSTSTLPPTAVDDGYGMTANQTLTVPAQGVLMNDNANGGGAMTASLVSGPSAGSLALGVNGGFTYLPPANFTGTVTFSYRASHSGGFSNIATVTISVIHPSAPQPPTDLVVDAVQGLLVTVRFTPPLLGPAPTGYILRGGVLPGEVLATLPTGHAAPVFTFVAPIGSFHIRMHALANGSESAPSDEVPLHVGVPVPPSAPSRLTGTVNGSSVSLAWKHTFGGGPATDTLLDVTGSINTTLSLGAAESFSFPGVPVGTYTFRVRGANGGGTSAASGPVTLSFPGACSGPPLLLDRFLAYTVGATIFVIWDPPDTGPAPTQYMVTVSGAFAGTFPTTARMISGTVGPGSYGLSVRAVNACGTSPPTLEQIVTVP